MEQFDQDSWSKDKRFDRDTWSKDKRFDQDTWSKDKRFDQDTWSKDTQFDQDKQSDQDKRSEEREFYMPCPDNYLALAIICTICFCMPLGVYGIIRAGNVNRLYLAGMYEEAVRAAHDAKKWSIIGIVGGVAIHIILLGAYATMVYFTVIQ